MVTTSQVQGQSGNAVMDWFGEGFKQLNPLLKALHLQDSRLSGPVLLQFGTGWGGVLGRRLARKLGIPDDAGHHHLDVEISHDETTLFWSRCFDRTRRLRSTFRPNGCWPDGDWTEHTGPLEVMLKVDIIEGGWYWRVTRVRLRGIPVPLWLIPRSAAYKRIEGGKYRFHVSFSLPVVGAVFSYSGLLEPM